MVRLFISLFLFFCSFPAFAASTYYVRDDGGDGTRCTGLVNAPDPGSGTAQPCAYNHPRYSLGWACGGGGGSCSHSGTLSASDTLSINGDSQLSPGTQAQYKIGYDTGGATPGCSTSFPYDCTLGNVPAGTDSSHQTKIIGIGTNKPQFWGNERVSQVLSATHGNTDIEYLEITDHSSCGGGFNVNGCQRGSYPYGPYGDTGLYLGGTGNSVSNVYVHGMAYYGIDVNSDIGTITFTNMLSIGNGQGGWNSDPTVAFSGTITMLSPIVEWSGCEEAYPLTNAGIDNPSNYSNCSGQQSNVIADGIAFGNTGNGNAGNWTIKGPGSISFNTQDGLDTLHGAGNGTIQIDKMRFEGNGGNGIKANAANFNLTNSEILGDCGWWIGAAQSISGGMSASGDVCRADGTPVVFNVTSGSAANILNNTFICNGLSCMEPGDAGNTNTCDGTTSIKLNNNIIQAGYWVTQDSTINPGGNDKLSAMYYDLGISYATSFNVTGVTVWPTVGAVYTNNGNSYTQFFGPSSGSSGTIFFKGNGIPLNNSTLTKTSGTGDATISYTGTPQGQGGNGVGACGPVGNGTGGALVWTEDYNIVNGAYNSNAGCLGAHDKCGTSPGFINPIPLGTFQGGTNTFYQGQSGVTYMPISSGSAAKGAGNTGYTYWNTINDYYNNLRPTISIGALEYNSSAVNGFTPCFFNSDCSSNTCTSNICVASGGGSGTGDTFTNVTIRNITFK